LTFPELPAQVDHADVPATHPDAKGELALLGLDESDELAVRLLNSHHIKKARAFDFQCSLQLFAS
jgi:hypothetical protein